MEKTTTEKRWATSVLHPTDLSTGSDTAFAHALAIAVIGQARFTIMHVGRNADPDTSWSEFPQVRETLTRWGLLAAGSAPADVFSRLGMRVKKIEARTHDTISAILDYLETHEIDLLVLATEGREGLPRWLKPSIAEPLARRSEIATLFVPQGVEGFVPLDSANIKLNRILIPLDERPDATRALDIAQRWAEILGDETQVSLIHIGDSPELATTYERYAETAGWSFDELSGGVVEAIIETARRDSVDLIVMPTAGRENFLDVLRGSTSEQVLRRAPCPVLTVPAPGY